MRRFRDIALIAGALALLAAFGAGLSRLFALRFSAGDIYPDYSTLNAGPKGAQALFESLQKVEGLTVERNFVPLDLAKETAGSTLILAGAGDGGPLPGMSSANFFGDDTPKNFEKFEAMIAAGCDVIVTLAAASMPAWTEHKVDEPMKDPWSPWRVRDQPRPAKEPQTGREDAEVDTAPPRKEPPGAESSGSESVVHEKGGDAAAEKAEGKEKEEDAEEEKTLVAAERWQFSFLNAVDKKDLPRAGWAVEAADGVPPPPSFPQWFSPWRFVGEDAHWQTLAVIDGRPVIIRRRFGDGSLTLVSDSAFLSNEALWRAPRPGFLLWLFAQRPRLIFDETHHGTASNPGVMFLARRYRLLGFLCGAAVLLALFVWRASSRLVPPPAPIRTGGDRIEGAESLGGFRDLMRQNVDRRNLLATCYAEWAKSPFVRRRHAASRIEAVRAIVESVKSRKSAPVIEGYRAAARHLSRRN